MINSFFTKGSSLKIVNRFYNAGRLVPAPSEGVKEIESATSLKSSLIAHGGDKNSMKLALEKIATMEDLKMTETEQIPLLKKIIETHKMMSDGAVGGALALRLATPTTESIVSTINNDHEITMVRYMDILASRYKTPKTPDEEKPTDISYPG